MLRINPIKNVNNTLNNRVNPISFKAGVQTNYGLDIESSDKNMVEGGLLTGFAGIIQKSISILNPKVINRAQTIEAGLDQTKKLNKVA